MFRAIWSWYQLYSINICCETQVYRFTFNGQKDVMFYVGGHMYTNLLMCSVSGTGSIVKWWRTLPKVHHEILPLYLLLDQFSQFKNFLSYFLSHWLTLILFSCLYLGLVRSLSSKAFSPEIYMSFCPPTYLPRVYSGSDKTPCIRKPSRYVWLHPLHLYPEVNGSACSRISEYLVSLVTLLSISSWMPWKSPRLPLMD